MFFVVCFVLLTLCYFHSEMSEKKSGHVCAVPNCSIKGYNSKKKFYRFPKDLERARIWAMKANREDLLEKLTDLYKSYRLCENHFEENMFTSHLHTRLLATALPTLFPSLEGSSKTAIHDHSYSAPPLLSTKIPILHDHDRILVPAIADDKGSLISAVAVTVSATQTITVDTKFKDVVVIESNLPNVTSPLLMSSTHLTSTQTPICLSSDTQRKNVVKSDLISHQTYLDLINAPSLENEEITIKNEVKEELNEGTNVNIKVEAWPCEYIENREGCNEHQEQILRSELQIKEETPDEYTTPLKVTLAEIKKEIEEASLQEPTDVIPAELHVFRCTECSYNNEDSLKFKNHIRKTHKKSNSAEYLTCEQCQYKTLNKQLLDVHVLLSHSDVANIKKYECKRCIYKTLDSECYSKHLKNKKCSGLSAESGTVYKCELCSYQTTGKLYFKRHRLVHEKHRKFYQCELCEYKVLKKCSLRNHMKVHEGCSELKYKCNDCNYSTAYKNSLDVHKASHKHVSNIEFKYKCTECSYNTANEEDFERHKSTHAKQAIYRCKSCDYKVLGRLRLMKHMKQAHGDGTEQVYRYRCEICNYQIDRRRHFENHMRRHEKTGSKWLFCAHCNYKAKDKEILQGHIMKFHVEAWKALKYDCGDCNYSTFFKNEYDKHVSRHKRETDCERFKCDDCTFETIDKLYFREHKFSHERPEVFECELCNYKVMAQRPLHSHVKHMHGDLSENVKFTCEQCDYSTIYKTCYTDHMTKHVDHSKLPSFKCEFCDFETVNRQSLRVHVRLHNPDATALKEFTCKWCSYKTVRKRDLLKHMASKCVCKVVKSEHDG